MKIPSHVRFSKGIIGKDTAMAVLYASDAINRLYEGNLGNIELVAEGIGRDFRLVLRREFYGSKMTTNRVPIGYVKAYREHSGNELLDKGRLTVTIGDGHFDFSHSRNGTRRIRKGSLDFHDDDIRSIEAQLDMHPIR